AMDDSDRRAAALRRSGEQGAADATEKASKPAFRVSPQGALRIGAALGGMVLFILALEVIKAGAAGLVPVLDSINVTGAANATGFGWLFAYVVLSGSPVAAIGVSLFAEGVFSQEETFAIIAGSRFGASFIVLAVGFVYYVRGRR